MKRFRNKIARKRREDKKIAKRKQNNKCGLITEMLKKGVNSWGIDWKWSK